MKLSLPNGATGFTDDSGQWICTGSQMGRRNVLPDDSKTASHKLHLLRAPFIDGCYDRWGAYFGGPENVWFAFAGDRMKTEVRHFHHLSTQCKSETQVNDFDVFVSVRAESREAAKQAVRKSIPNARFYR